MSALADILRAQIAADGPMSVARFMQLCLSHPDHGYYTTRDPFGAAGDFITAPEISQMFGELLGLWLAQVWMDMGAPSPVRVVELGPGRGTLMADALRAARAAPGFVDALQVWLVETSPALRVAQTRVVPLARHAASLEDVPEGPTLLVANEFFDALPIRQFVRAGGAWRERVVALRDGRLVWGLGPAHPGAGPEDAAEGAVIERAPLAEAIARAIGERLSAHGGAALALDYGAAPGDRPGGDTLQALRAHAPADPLETPGAADLTAHVDFSALAAALAAGGARVAPLATQGRLLGALGLDARAAALAAAHPDRAAEIEAARRRLSAPEAMGTLFKALAATGPDHPVPPPGFAPALAGEARDGA